MFRFGDEVRFLPQQSALFQHACSTPMTILLALLEKQIKGGVHTADSTVAYTAAKRLYTLIYDRSYKGRASKLFCVNTAVEEIISLFSSSLHTKSQVNCVGTVISTAKLRGNKLYFQEMIICLLNNAIEAYKASISKQVIVRLSNNKRYVTLEVIDGGRGMRWLRCQLATVRGFSTKGNNRGYGLGFVRDVTQHFNGQMQICSTIGIGTRVVIKLPLAK